MIKNINAPTILRIICTSVLITLVILLSGCTNSMKILEGADAACGSIHLDGYATDSRGDIKIMKFPDSWTPEQVADFCS